MTLAIQIILFALLFVWSACCGVWLVTVAIELDAMKSQIDRLEMQVSSIITGRSQKPPFTHKEAHAKLSDD